MNFGNESVSREGTPLFFLQEYHYRALISTFAQEYHSRRFILTLSQEYNSKGLNFGNLLAL